MKLHEVLGLPAVASGDMWFRPVGWPQGYAYCVKDGQCCVVPGLRGSGCGLLCGMTELRGEWEPVASSEVLGRIMR